MITLSHRFITATLGLPLDATEQQVAAAIAALGERIERRSYAMTREEAVAEHEEQHRPPNWQERAAWWLTQAEQQSATDAEREPPYRLCCGKQHYGPVCPDGLVMCCLCFERVPREQLHVLPDGRREDVCAVCAEEEQRFRNERERKP